MMRSSDRRAVALLAAACAAAVLIGVFTPAQGAPPAAAEATAPAPGQVGTTRLTEKVKTAINKGLAYLAKTQKKDDSKSKDYGSWGSRSHAVADTSVSLMAFMLQGHVPGRGMYGRHLNKGITFLLNLGKTQKGYLGTPRNHAGMYEHGLAILALSEAWGQSKNRKIRTALRKAVDITLRAQNSAGGWRYSPEPRDADLSMTVMQIVALNSAREAGIAVPDRTIERAKKYVLSCQDKDSGGFCYMANGGEPGLARTAAGVMSLIMCGERRHTATKRGMAFMMHYPPDTKFSARFSRFHYTHYYAIQCMYQFGDNTFRAWYSRVSATILATQGSDGAWNSTHGKEFGTGVSILVLGVPYRFLPIYQR